MRVGVNLPKGTKSNETADDKAAVKSAVNNLDRALLRMHRAAERGTGCHLDADMVWALSVTVVGEWWGEIADRHANSSNTGRSEKP